MTRFHILSFMLIALMVTGCKHTDWRTADRSSMGLAPLPVETPEAVVQVYAARAINWRGFFAVHSWIATKEPYADHYVTYHVMGFRLRHSDTSVVMNPDIPDRRWYGADVQLIEEIRGEAAESAIPKIRAAAEDYPYAGRYSAWPGPNSNTFISYILRRTPELTVELPPNAIGKDWLGYARLFSLSESGTGAQASIYGLLGVTFGLAEGFEVNIIGLSFGIDILRPALKLPLVGRIGMDDRPLNF